MKNSHILVSGVEVAVVVGSVPLVESVPVVGSVLLSGGVVVVTVVPSDVNNTQLKLGHYNKHT